jgi:hypothetical protein
VRNISPCGNYTIVSTILINMFLPGVASWRWKEHVPEKHRHHHHHHPARAKTL